MTRADLVVVATRSEAHSVAKQQQRRKLLENNSNLTKMFTEQTY